MHTMCGLFLSPSQSLAKFPSRKAFFVIGFCVSSVLLRSQAAQGGLPGCNLRKFFTRRTLISIEAPHKKNATVWLSKVLSRWKCRYVRWILHRSHRSACPKWGINFSKYPFPSFYPPKLSACQSLYWLSSLLNDNLQLKACWTDS